METIVIFMQVFGLDHLKQFAQRNKDFEYNKIFVNYIISTVVRHKIGLIVKLFGAINGKFEFKSYCDEEDNRFNDIVIRNFLPF